MADNNFDYDYIIAGAGVSGIGCCHYLNTMFPGSRILILEGRDNIGGTWDLFKYPGIRSDSDMYTFGYSFNPWIDKKSFADGHSIMNYLQYTVKKFDLEKFIKFGCKINAASWKSSANKWNLTVTNKSGTKDIYTTQFLIMCTGYYNYEKGHVPDFEGIETYKGTIIQPQKWPEGLDYSNKNIVVIGSGATAITLVPSLAEKASHVTMLQRSPTYISAVPSEDNIAALLYRYLPRSLAFTCCRWYRILFTAFFYYICIKYPKTMKNVIIDEIRKRLPPDFDTNTHFTPSYNPWEQRFCVGPDGDIFKAIKGGKASVITSHIERFTTTGIQLKNTSINTTITSITTPTTNTTDVNTTTTTTGTTTTSATSNENKSEIEADIVVIATGLRLELFGQIAIDIDGIPIDQINMLSYKGFMFNRIPNFIQFVGYINASWTLRVDLITSYLKRLFTYMKCNNYKVFQPIHDKKLDSSKDGIVQFHDGYNSSYFHRAMHSKEVLWPYCYSRYPWKNNKWILMDMWMLSYSRVHDREMHFR